MTTNLRPWSAISKTFSGQLRYRCGVGEIENRVCQEDSHIAIWEKCEGMIKCELTASDEAMRATRCLEESQYTYNKYISVIYRCDATGKYCIAQSSRSSHSAYSQEKHKSGRVDLNPHGEVGYQPILRMDQAMLS